jgi:hypothetical protein
MLGMRLLIAAIKKRLINEFTEAWHMNQANIGNFSSGKLLNGLPSWQYPSHF